FHHLLVESAGNSKLLRAYESSHIPLFHMRVGQTREYLDDYAETEREHREILSALKAGHTEEAVKKLRAHFNRREQEDFAQRRFWQKVLNIMLSKMPCFC